MPKNLAQDCIDTALKMTRLEPLRNNVIQVGSLYKDVMGDIDLSIEKSSLENFLGLKNPSKKELFDSVEQFLNKNLKKNSFIINRGLAQFHLAVPLAGNKDKLVQVDFFPSNNKWTKDFLVQNRSENDGIGGSKTEISLPAKYRNILLYCIGSVASKQESFDGTWTRLFIDVKEGLFRQTYAIILGQNKEISREFLTDNIDEACQEIIDRECMWDKVDSCWKMLNYFQNSSFIGNKNKMNVYTEYSAAIQKTKLEQPKFIAEKLKQDDW